MRARIALRRHRILLPATKANDEEKLVRAEVSAIKINKGKPLTEDDIIAAFSKGDEVREQPILSQGSTYDDSV